MCSLETGQVLTQPIGYIESCFTGKNGTPRQPSICSLSRGCLRISKKIFNNPEHSLMGLQQFSHVWILFIFHKNGHLSWKAKVRPPRLNGEKTGVFSTRSPHRPNAIGLTLAKLDKVEGDTVYLSGIDMIQGTPVIDIKPYIAEYDSPRPKGSLKECLEEVTSQAEGGDVSSPVFQRKNSEHKKRSEQDDHNPFLDIDDQSVDKCDLSGQILDNVLETDSEPSSVEDTCSLPEFSSKLLVEEDIKNLKQSQDLPGQRNGSFSESQDKPGTCDSFVAKWVTESPVPRLTVRFTPHSEKELRQFKSSCEQGEPSFRFFQSVEEAKYAITKILSADPRSVYRRNQCLDRLFYFSLDTIHITCWFGDGFAEVLQIQPVAEQAKT
ncbi:tRNA (adenine(37)-N6)-methyltransferase [Bufo gargarizans]|uniref:tRNA (adenine(37)-N6)-methyltransferase n=1 Tax=Bufo gargarizans TaxID=30331 RepID=UPI001CF525B0|nr:tRNA (adenine(37)-N6)-methyltransferase [Bufo gargarizans]